MDLKREIIIRNEFSNKYYASGGDLGSRGGSFQAYIVGYMARDEASDALFPLDSQVETIFEDDYANELDNRLLGKMSTLTDEETSEILFGDLTNRSMKYDGLAFDDKRLSMSYTEVLNKSQEIQKAFEEGHSVQKFIVSFTDDYLRKMGVLPDDFRLTERGDHFGNVDQLKLRHAIQDGMHEMLQEGSFENPSWIGLIQLDTKHVHAHMVACDQVFGNSRLMADGLDRGKIYANERRAFRNGCHQSLERQLGLHQEVDQIHLLNDNTRRMLQRTVFDLAVEEIKEKQVFEQGFCVLDAPELVYKKRQEKVEAYFQDCIRDGSNLSKEDQDALIGLVLAFEQMKRELDLDDEESEKFDQIWIEESAKLFIEDMREPNEVESFRQLNQLLHKQRVKEIQFLNQEKQEVKTEKEGLFIDMLTQELEGYESRYQMQYGLGYDEAILSRYFPNRETKAQALLRSDRFEQLSTLAKDIDSSSELTAIFQRVTDNHRFLFLGSCLREKQTIISEYFEKSLNQKRWPIVALQLRPYELVDEINMTTELKPFESSFVEDLIPDIVIDKSEISSELEVGLITGNEENVESISETDVEGSFDNDVRHSEDVEQSAEIDEIVLENDADEMVVLTNEQEDQITEKDKIYKDGLTLAQYIALYPELFDDEENAEEMNGNKYQIEDDLEI